MLYICTLITLLVQYICHILPIVETRDIRLEKIKLWVQHICHAVPIFGRLHFEYNISVIYYLKMGKLQSWLRYICRHISPTFGQFTLWVQYICIYLPIIWKGTLWVKYLGIFCTLHTFGQVTYTDNSTSWLWLWVHVIEYNAYISCALWNLYCNA